MVQGPSQPAQLRDDPQPDLVELHLLVRLDDHAGALRHVRGALGERHAFEHADGEAVAFGFPAHDVPGQTAERGCRVDDGGRVREDRGAAGAGEGGGAGGRGAEEGEVEHEVSGGEVRGGPGEVEGEGDVVGLDGRQGRGEVGCAVGVTVPRYVRAVSVRGRVRVSTSTVAGDRRTRTANARPARRCSGAHSCSRIRCRLRSRRR